MPTDRRRFLTASALSAAALLAPKSLARQPDDRRRFADPAPDDPGSAHRGMCAIASGNGVPAVKLAHKLMRANADPAEAAVEGVTLVEDDPNDMSVGFGGLPNERGVVQLDASVMHGPTHKAGAVACIEDIMNPARVALRVLRNTDHVMIVGPGAKEFAIAHGFKEANLLTDRARKAWLKWKRNLNPNDDWLDDDQRLGLLEELGLPEHLDVVVDANGVPHTTGTIHCSAVDANEDLGAVTTTSGLSYKIPGRVGDSPIIGAGMYVDNMIGSAGATGRGEAVIQSCGSYEAVRAMGEGMTPQEACLHVLKRIADRTKRHDLLNDRGEPNFNVTMYALRKDGAYGSACMRGRRPFAVEDGQGARTVTCASLFE